MGILPPRGDTERKKLAGGLQPRPALLLMIERAQRPVPAAQWKAAGEAAFGHGRLREAFRCFQKAGHEEGLARVRERLPGYEIYVPQGK